MQPLNPYGEVANLASSTEKSQSSNTALNPYGEDTILASGAEKL